MDNNTIKNKLREFIKKESGFDSAFGKISISDFTPLGEGGNGLVYKGSINDQELAIKFLITDSREKHKRFLAEYFNINYFRSELKYIANMIYYGEIELDNECHILIPYILMTKYKESLKQYHQRSDLSFDDLKRLFEALCISVKSLHDHNILHRAIKPENILLDDNKNIYLADFGIAAFDDMISPIDIKTNPASRLANISFSAPEQIDHSSEPTKASDIYSIGQLLFWYAFNRLNKGIDDSKLNVLFNNEDSYILDEIIKKCLMNKPEQRFQSINEIVEFWNEEKRRSKEINPFDDMYYFQEAILDVYPECYSRIRYIGDQDIIKKLLNGIMKPNYHQKLWFNDGLANNAIHLLEQENDNEYLINQSLHTINGIWCYTSSDEYNDILLIERTTPQLFNIDDKEYDCVLKIDEKYYPGDSIDSGRIRLEDGSVKRIDELSNVKEIYITDYGKYIIIAPRSNLFIYRKNDYLLRSLNKKSEICEADIWDMIKLLEKSDEIVQYL